ncbi:MAG: hypothetical protein ACLTQG_30350 [Hungatella sp.]|uniref:hypothetical protein n=1 Tax=Hungatella sp. TaxID=2613924 RepID=UPI003991D956
MYLQNIGGMKEERIKGLLEVKEALWNLINFQSRTEENELRRDFLRTLDREIRAVFKENEPWYTTGLRPRYGYVNS